MVRKAPSFIISILMILILSVVALGAEKSFKGVTLTCAMQGLSPQEAIRDALPEFEKKTGIKVDWHVIPYPDLRDKQVLNFVSHSAVYDIVWVDTIWVVEYATNGWIMDVSDWVKRDWDELDMEDIAEPLWDYGLRWNGKWWGLGNTAHMGIMSYRKDLYDKFGLQPPETWEDQLRNSLILTYKDPETGKQVYGTILRYCRRGEGIVSDWFHFTGCWSTYPSKFRAGWFYKDMRPALNSSDLVEATQFMIDLYKRWHVVPPEVESYTFNEVMRDMMEGKAASHITETWAIPTEFNPEKAPLVYDKVAACAPPGRKDKSGKLKRRPFSGGLFANGINVDSKNKEAAWELVKWINSKEGQREIVKHGGTTFRYSIWGDPELQETHPWYAAMPTVVDNTLYRPMIKDYMKIRILAAEYLSRIVAGEFTAKDGLDILNGKVDEIMKKGGYYD